MPDAPTADGRGTYAEARTALLKAVRALPPAHGAWIEETSHAAYQVEVRTTWIPGIVGIYIDEIDLGGIVETPSGAWYATVRQYTVLPLQPRVLLKIRAEPLPGSPDYDQPRARVAVLAQIQESWLGRGPLRMHADEDEVRQLTARLASVKALT